MKEISINEIESMLGLNKINPVVKWRIKVARNHIQRAERIIKLCYTRKMKAKAAIKREEKLIKEIKRKWNM